MVKFNPYNYENYFGGNPVQRHYDHFLKHFHGSRVILHDVHKDGEDKYRDEYIYEILNKGE